MNITDAIHAARNTDRAILVSGVMPRILFSNDGYLHAKCASNLHAKCASKQPTIAQSLFSFNLEDSFLTRDDLTLSEDYDWHGKPIKKPTIVDGSNYQQYLGKQVRGRLVPEMSGPLIGLDPNNIGPNSNKGSFVIKCNGSYTTISSPAILVE